MAEYPIREAARLSGLPATAIRYYESISRFDIVDTFVRNGEYMTDIANWLAQYASESFTYFTTTGRTSGKPHRIEIWFGVDQDRMFLMAGGRDTSDWVKNLIANPNVIVELGSETRHGIGRVIDSDAPEDGCVRNLLVDKYGKDRDLEDWKKRSLPVVISFPSE